MKTFIYICLLILLAFTGNAQTFKADIKDLSFMAGTWQQHHKWGDMEEYWGPPMGDNMVCSYRCFKNGKVLFYEFIVIEQTDSVPVMKLRHFNPGNIGWEDKDKPYSYPLTQLTNNKAIFEAIDKSLYMSYERTGINTMEIVLKEKDKAGKWSTEMFNYTLK